MRGEARDRALDDRLLSLRGEAAVALDARPLADRLEHVGAAVLGMAVRTVGRGDFVRRVHARLVAAEAFFIGDWLEGVVAAVALVAEEGVIARDRTRQELARPHGRM